MRHDEDELNDKCYQHQTRNIFKQKCQSQNPTEVCMDHIKTAIYSSFEQVLCHQQSGRIKPGNDRLLIVGWSVLSGEDQYPSTHKQCRHH